MKFLETTCTEDIAKLVRPVSDSVIVGLESAAYFLGLATCYEEITEVKVFASRDVNSSGLQLFHLDSPAPADKEIIRFNGCWCTGEIQTIKDLLTPEFEVSPLIIMEVLLPYYLKSSDDLHYLKYFLTKEQWGCLQDILPAIKDSIGD